MWKDAIVTELASLHEYDTFEEMGKGLQPPGYKKIGTHFVFAVKHDLRHKGRMVADGHLHRQQEDPILAYFGPILTE
jgi:hypothetical protein